MWEIQNVHQWVNNPTIKNKQKERRNSVGENVCLKLEVTLKSDERLYNVSNFYLSSIEKLHRMQNLYKYFFF